MEITRGIIPNTINGDIMSKSIFVNEYNKFNVIGSDKIVITDIVNINYIDLVGYG